MTGLQIISLCVWVVGIILVLGALAVSIVARRIHEPRISLIAVLPIAVTVLMIAFHFGVASPSHVLNVLLAMSYAALGVFAGSPLTSLVVERASGDQQLGVFGGILVPSAGERAGKDTTREVLRGGAAIGYLERLAIIASIVVGHPEAIAGVIAIKGLGRFSELDSAEARERFIIGTLTSFIWAAACAAVIVLPGGALY